MCVFNFQLRVYGLRSNQQSYQVRLEEGMRGEDESPSISTVDEGEASKCSGSKDQETIIRDLFKEEIKENPRQ